MSRRDWAAATSLAECGWLMADWLVGTEPWRPGIVAPQDGPDEETHELVPALAAFNRAGWLTTDLQPGLVDAEWEQRAGVCGFAHDAVADRIEQAAAAAGLICHRWRIRRPRPFVVFHPSFAGTLVTFVDDRPHTRFGSPIDRNEVRFMFDGVGRRAVADILSAWQVDVVDPEWGRNDLLWKTLTEAITL